VLKNKIVQTFQSIFIFGSFLPHSNNKKRGERDENCQMNDFSQEGHLGIMSIF